MTRKTHFTRRAAMMMILAVILFWWIAPQSISTAAAETKDGLVRVLLTKLKLTDKIELSLDGSYTVNDISFQRGSKVTVSSTSGSLMLYYEGMALNAGQSVTFTRHAVKEGLENGARINGELYLHPGDLILTADNGQLRCVLRAPLEEYLVGVVPYEMSDSFPIEALKAQAVAARTYAMSKMGSSLDYDVVDNTNDQAYYGILDSHTNAVRAVAETSGLVGYYKGNLAICYYTASNGGQVELVQNVWGQGDYGYIIQHDDPYDVENPESVVKRASFKKKISADEDLKGLAPALKAALAEPMESLGYDGDIANIVIDEVTKIEAITPKFGDQSKLMTEIRFTLSVSGRKLATGEAAAEEEEVSIFVNPTATPSASPTAAAQKQQLGALGKVSKELTVTLPYFSELEKQLSLSINSGENEIVSVSEQADRFVLEARRYGHGVGMSQRGAQTMAGAHGMSFEQILSFYYPGLSFKQLNYSYALPSPVGAEFLATPGPPATPTPRPTLMPVTGSIATGQYKVRVTEIAQNSYLNLREKPDLTAGVLMRLYYGQELIVMEELADDWLRVKTDAAEGYIVSSFVQKTE